MKLYRSSGMDSTIGAKDRRADVIVLSDEKRMNEEG
jgi:hypothetical protein